MAQQTPLLFDLDGTITDPKPGFLASMDYAFEALGAPRPSHEELTQYIGPPLRGTFETLLQTKSPEEAEHAVALYRERLNTGGKFEANVYPGIHELLERLSGEGYRLFIATGKPRGMAREIATHFELAHLFEEIYGAELDGRFVDKAELIAHFSEIHDLPQGCGVMIGDTAFDMRAGRLNNLHTIGVEWGYGTNKAMREAGAEEIVSDASELKEAIKRYSANSA